MSPHRTHPAALAGLPASDLKLSPGTGAHRLGGGCRVLAGMSPTGVPRSQAVTTSSHALSPLILTALFHLPLPVGGEKCHSLPGAAELWVVSVQSLCPVPATAPPCPTGLLD